MRASLDPTPFPLPHKPLLRCWDLPPGAGGAGEGLGEGLGICPTGGEMSSPQPPTRPSRGCLRHREAHQLQGSGISPCVPHWSGPSCSPQPTRPLLPDSAISRKGSGSPWKGGLAHTQDWSSEAAPGAALTLPGHSPFLGLQSTWVPHFPLPPVAPHLSTGPALQMPRGSGLWVRGTWPWQESPEGRAEPAPPSPDQSMHGFRCSHSSWVQH